MKLLCFVIIFITSCSKENRIKNSSMAQENFSKFISIKSLSEQKNAYATLNPEEKIQMWNLHLDEKIISKQFTLIQQDFLKQSRKLLRPETFANGSNFQNSDEMIIWNYKASELFTKQEIFELFASFNNTPLTIEIAPNVVAGGNNCSCSAISDYCNVFGGGTGGWWKCDDGGKCDLVSSDCGAWWNYDCTSKCKYHTIF